MSSVPFVTGPVFVYVKLPTQIITGLAINTVGVKFPIAIPTGGLAYLGTSRGGPGGLQRRIRRHKEPVMNDEAGSRVSHDNLYMGCEGFVSLVLTKWDWGVYRAVQALPRLSSDGIDQPGDRGTLWDLEGRAAQLYLHFPYYQLKSVGKANGMPPGYRYPVAFFDDMDDLEPGLKANEVHVMFYCQSKFNSRAHTYTLYDNDMTGIPALPPS